MALPTGARPRTASLYDVSTTTCSTQQTSVTICINSAPATITTTISTVSGRRNAPIFPEVPRSAVRHFDCLPRNSVENTTAAGRRQALRLRSRILETSCEKDLPRRSCLDLSSSGSWPDTCLSRGRGHSQRGPHQAPFVGHPARRCTDERPVVVARAACRRRCCRLLARPACCRRR